MAVKIHELELASLLDEVLVEFDLSWSTQPERGTETDSVTATRRGAVPPFRVASAELVVARDTKMIRTLIIHRRGLGEHIATLTFQLQSSSPIDPSVFTPEGHLRAGAPVYDRSKPLLRRMLILKQIGNKLLNDM
jgi:hypothetical protein